MSLNCKPFMERLASVFQGTLTSSGVAWGPGGDAVKFNSAAHLTLEATAELILAAAPTGYVKQGEHLFPYIEECEGATPKFFLEWDAGGDMGLMGLVVELAGTAEAPLLLVDEQCF